MGCLWRLRRKAKIACTEGYCATDRADRIARIGLWTAIVLIVIALVFPYLIRALLTSRSSQSEPLMKSQRILPLTMALCIGALPIAALAADTTVVLDVHHAGCVLCGPIVKSTLHVKGVKSVAVSQPNGMADVTARVSYNPAVTSAATLIKAVANRGYPASVATEASGAKT